MRSCLLPWLLLVGCPKPSVGGVVDPTLPEDAAAVAPADALATLATGADSLDPEVRASALALLVRHVGADPWGRRAMFDPSAWVRRRAIDALGARTDDLSRSLLEAQAADGEADPYVRGAAATRAGPGAAAAMGEALADEHEPWRVAPLALAAATLGDSEALVALRSALASGELPMDLEFLHEIGASGLDLAGALGEAQERVEEELALPVASARLMLGDAAGEQVLRRALSDPDEEVRMEALDYVAEVDHPAADALLRRGSSLGPDRVRAYAELVLAARSGGGADVFSRVYASEDPELRRLAVRYAARAAAQLPGRRADRDTTGVIVQGLADGDAAVRREACRAAAALPPDGLPEPRQALEALLADEAELVRIEAAGALLAVGG